MKAHNFLLKKLILLIVAFLFISCNSNAENEMLSDKTSKERLEMPNTTQPFINPQLNSLLAYDLASKGILSWKLEYNLKGIPGGAVSLLLMDDSRAILDYSNVFFLIDTFNNKILGFLNKSANTFIFVCNEQEFNVFSSFRLFKLKFDTSQSLPKKSYFVPGLGNYSRLFVFVPKADTYIVGTQSFGNPMYPEKAFGLLEKTYVGYDDKWNLAFNGLVVRPPVSLDGNFVIAQKDLISIVDSNGKAKEIKVEMLPVSCSIGADNLIYMVCKIKNKNFIKAMDFDGSIRWECVTSIAQLNQPPIVSKESTVFLIGSSKVEAFANGGKLWELQLTGTDKERQFASVSNDGMLLVSDCDKLLCINKAGEQVWAFKVAKGETIMTQPVLDSVGKVFIATDKKVLAIK